MGAQAENGLGSMSEGSARECSWRVAALCAAWYALSAASNAVGKAALREFPRPAALAAGQLLLTAGWLVPTLRLLRAPPLSVRRHARALLPLAALKFLSTACSQLSISLVPVSYAHTVKATTPLWTAALAWLVSGQRVSRRVAAALCVIAGGVALAAGGAGGEAGAGGLAAALAAAALLAAQHVATKRAILEPGVHHLRLLQVLTALAAGPALAAAWAGEGAAALGAGGGGRRWALYVAADGTLAFLQAAAAFALLRRVSPLTYGVASAAKRVCVVAAALLLLGEPAPPARAAGMLLAGAGVLLYARAKHAAPAPAPRRARPLLPL